MGIFDRFRRTDTVIAAGQLIPADTAKAPSVKESGKKKRQDQAWDHYEQIPEIWFATNFVANALRRARIYPATQIDPMQAPVPLTPEDGRVFYNADATLDLLRSRDGTHGELLHDLSVQLSIPGEGYLISDVIDGEEQYVVKSVDEFRYDSSNKTWKIYDSPEDREGRPQAANAYRSRIYRQHPRWSALADSGMYAVRDECSELLDLQRYYRTAARSRMNAGFLVVPSEAIIKKNDAVTGAEDGQVQITDPFLRMLMNSMMAPINDEDSAAAIVPGLVKMAAQYIEKIKHITFEREFDKTAAARMDVLLKRIAAGLDLPSEVVLGMSDVNHWTAWQVDQATFDSHLAPLLELICAALTEAYLRPMLGTDGGAEQVIVWYDPSAMISHPNKSKDADMAHDRYTISDATYRRLKGYQETDAPTPEEIKERSERKSNTDLRPSTGGRGATPEDDPDDPEPTVEGPPGASLIASGAPAVGNLGEDLRQIDRQLRNRLQVQSQTIVFKALESAGAKMRSRLSRSSGMWNAIEHVSDDMVCAVLGREFVSQFVTDDELIEDGVTPIVPIYKKMTAAAQRSARAHVRRYDTDDRIDWEQIANQQQSDRDAGATLLTAGLISVVAGALYQVGANTAERGEVRTDSLVPTGVIRDTLVRAGGGRVLSATGTRDPVSGRPQGEVALGTEIMDLLHQLEITPSAWVWHYGSPDNPFLGHQELDGVVFLDWQDEQLRVHPEDEWLGTEYYFPGDHGFCQCDFGPELTIGE